jgi:hypothetical protein
VEDSSLSQDYGTATSGMDGQWHKGVSVEVMKARQSDTLRYVDVGDLFLGSISLLTLPDAILQCH